MGEELAIGGVVGRLEVDGGGARGGGDGRERGVRVQGVVYMARGGGVGMWNACDVGGAVGWVFVS